VTTLTIRECDPATVHEHLARLGRTLATLGDVSPSLPHVAWLRARIAEWNA
jgi:hypothetical protein